MANNNNFKKGLRDCLGAIPLMFLGPILIHNAWINKHTHLHYFVLIFGLIISLLSIFLMWRGVIKVVKSL